MNAVEPWLAISGFAAFGYAIGSLSAGYLVGRLYRGVDLRETGSGSTGATNALRALGPGAAAAVATLDIAKGALAVLISGAIAGTGLPQAAAALGAVAGHCWPIGLRGRGGRGMTPAVGATLLLVPQVAPIALAAFVGGVALTRIVSVGSLAAVTFAGLGYVALIAVGVLGFDGARFGFLAGTAAIVLVRHAPNIRRLAARLEPRLGSKSVVPQPVIRRERRGASQPATAPAGSGETIRSARARRCDAEGSVRLVRAAAIWVGGIVLGLALVLALSVAVDAAVGANRIMDVTNVEVPGSPDGPALRAYVARPAQPGPRPIVVMIHEFYGLNASITGKADLLAREGYLVVAPDTFRGSTTSWIPRAIYQTITAKPEVVNRDIDAVVRWAKAQPGADPSRVAIVGFCYGGRTSLLYTLHDPSVAATVVFYGDPETDAERLKVIRGPVLGIFGGADASIPVARADAFRAGLEAAGVRGRVTVYAGQPHAFVVDAAGVRAGGAQAQAWSEMVGFLRESLAAPRARPAHGDERAASAAPAISQLFVLAIEHARDARSHLH